MKVIVGLGNPGAEYDATRHNVGWWLIDRAAYEWKFPTFRKEGRGLVSSGRCGDHRAQLVKPATFMNRSGSAIGHLRGQEDFDPARDLMVLVDDATRDVGGVRIRPGGSAGGHNGLKSINAALGTQDYPRLRIGVGQCPEGVDLADWVLSEMPAEEEDVIVGLLPELTEALRLWMDEGVEAAMSRFNR